MRFLFLLLVGFITLFANANRHTIVQEYQLSKDGTHYSTIEDFQSLEDIKDFTGATLFHKFILDKEIIGTHTYYLKSLGNAQGIQKVSLAHRIVDNNIIIKIDKNTPSEIIIETKTPTRASFLLFNVLDDYEDYLKNNTLKDSSESQIEFVHKSMTMKSSKSPHDLGWKKRQSLQGMFNSKDTDAVSDTLMKNYFMSGIPHIKRRKKSARGFPLIP